MKAEQLSFDVPDIYTELRMDREQKKAKRRWEDHFQKWSNEQSRDGTQPYGCCGTGGLCDYCEENDYDRPCVRALNALCRTEKKQIDYSDYDFKKILVVLMRWPMMFRLAILKKGRIYGWQNENDDIR